MLHALIGQIQFWRWKQWSSIHDGKLNILNQIKSTGNTHNWNWIYFYILYQLPSLLQFSTCQSITTYVVVEQSVNWNHIEEYIQFQLGAVSVSFTLLYTHFIQGFTNTTYSTRPAHRSLATSQTSELVGKAPKTCNPYPDAIFKWHH